MSQVPLSQSLTRSLSQPQSQPQSPFSQSVPVSFSANTRSVGGCSATAAGVNHQSSAGAGLGGGTGADSGAPGPEHNGSKINAQAPGAEGEEGETQSRNLLRKVYLFNIPL